MASGCGPTRMQFYICRIVLAAEIAEMSQLFQKLTVRLQAVVDTHGAFPRAFVGVWRLILVATTS